MKHPRIFLVLLCISSAVGLSCTQAETPKTEAETTNSAVTPEPVKPPADTIAVVGSLVDKNGGPVVGRLVSIHPLDNKGVPLFVSIFEETGSGGVTPKPWNPRAETTAEGRFELQMPRVSKIGDDPLKEVALAIDAKPAGGWVVGKVSTLTYADPNKKEDMCFTKDDPKLKLLRNESGVLKIDLASGAGPIDVGKIVVD